jgi:hypothetical protein
VRLNRCRALGIVRWRLARHDEQCRIRQRLCSSWNHSCQQQQQHKWFFTTSLHGNIIQFRRCLVRGSVLFLARVLQPNCRREHHACARIHSCVAQILPIFFGTKNRRSVNHDRKIWDKRVVRFLAGLMDANTRDVLDTLRLCRWSYADFVRDMIRRASTDYSDPTLFDRSTSAMNRVPALNGTDLLVQTSLAYVTFCDQDRALAVPIPVQYTVKMNQTYFQYAVSNTSRDLPLTTHAKKASRTFSYRDWSHFHLYPPRVEQADIMVASPKGSSNSRNASHRVSLAAPFGGSTPNVGQIAAIASAALPHYAASTPSIMAQFFSVKRYDVTRSKRFFSRIALRTAELLVAKFLYTSRLANELAVCTQWPVVCGARDGRFLDGSFTDGPCTLTGWFVLSRLFSCLVCGCL